MHPTHAARDFSDRKREEGNGDNGMETNVVNGAAETYVALQTAKASQ